MVRYGLANLGSLRLQLARISPLASIPNGHDSSIPGQCETNVASSDRIRVGDGKDLTVAVLVEQAEGLLELGDLLLGELLRHAPPQDSESGTRAIRRRRSVPKGRARRGKEERDKRQISSSLCSPTSGASQGRLRRPSNGVITDKRYIGRLSNICGAKASSNTSNGDAAAALKGSSTAPVDSKLGSRGASQAAADPGRDSAIDESVAAISATLESRPVSFCTRPRNLAALVVTFMGLEMYTTLMGSFLALACPGVFRGTTLGLPMSGMAAARPGEGEIWREGSTRAAGAGLCCWLLLPTDMGERMKQSREKVYCRGRRCGIQQGILGYLW
ncbi:hypothetical protein GW17_00059606 [Ensete ventricosum]|nr:hypothetical protein GW17_00059606 [Ensete ventricosum]